MKNMVKNEIVLLDPNSEALCYHSLTLLNLFILIEMKNMVKNEIVLLDPYLVPTCMYLIDKERAGEQPGVGAGGEEQLETEEKPGEGLEE